MCRGIKYKIIKKNTKKYAIQTNPRPLPPKGGRKTLLKRGEGGVIHPPVKTKPFDKRNPKTAPPRSDSCQKGYICIPKTAIKRYPSNQSRKNHPTGEGGPATSSETGASAASTAGGRTPSTPRIPPASATILPLKDSSPPREADQRDDCILQVEPVHVQTLRHEVPVQPDERARRTPSPSTILSPLSTSSQASPHRPREAIE